MTSREALQHIAEGRTPNGWIISNPGAYARASLDRIERADQSHTELRGQLAIALSGNLIPADTAWAILRRWDALTA